MTKFYHLEDSEWVRITKKDHKHRCCDCSLTHIVSYRNGPNGPLETRWKIDAKATAAARRKFKSRRKRIESGGDHGVVHIFNLANC